MADEDNEDVMHKRETIMADGHRKLCFFTFGDDAAEASDKSDEDALVEETVNE